MNDMASPPSDKKCRLCGSNKLVLAKKSDLTTELSSVNFSITDSHYGQSLDLFSCGDCGFLQNLDTAEIGRYYEGLEDVEYENTREPRGLQAKKILAGLKKYVPAGRLIDIGAGSGILVEKAQRVGYNAVGVEPSVWLQQRAVELKLPVLLGTLPHPDAGTGYDVATLVDVIEHVDDPVGVLLNVKAVLKDDGFLLLTTPDVGSFFAKIMGWKWWDYRIAHINYFNLQTLKLLLDKAGFELVKTSRPNWYFTLSYFLERAGQYLPKILRFKPPAILKKIIIPLNLFDSYEIICRVKKKQLF
ncbi:MAG: methyltransferase domain-containing protein [Patescibacteria group bacterium]|nr:methyltransferase domain-containing protein [Patescibacteria group bacterium]